MANPLQAAALAYATLGRPVFPLVPGTKRPRTHHGFLDATLDPAQIKEWWGRWPLANIGMPTGEITDTTVLDVDMKAWEGKHGDRTLATLEATHGTLPATVKLWTWSGGYQLWFRYHPGIANCADAFGPWLDARTTGGYIVLPPSAIVDGERSGLYHWDSDGTGPRAMLPEWLVRVHVGACPSGETPREGETKPTPHLLPLNPLPDVIPYHYRRLTLKRLGLRCRLKGWSAESIAKKLHKENLARCKARDGVTPLPLDAQEMEAVIHHVLTVPDQPRYRRG